MLFKVLASKVLYRICTISNYSELLCLTEFVRVTTRQANLCNLAFSCSDFWTRSSMMHLCSNLIWSINEMIMHNDVLCRACITEFESRLPNLSNGIRWSWMNAESSQEFGMLGDPDSVISFALIDWQTPIHGTNRIKSYSINWWLIIGRLIIRRPIKHRTKLVYFGISLVRGSVMLYALILSGIQSTRLNFRSCAQAVQGWKIVKKSTRVIRGIAMRVWWWCYCSCAFSFVWSFALVYSVSSPPCLSIL